MSAPFARDGWRVEAAEYSPAVRRFVARWHYAGYPNGVCISHAFVLLDDAGALRGVALYGPLGMAGVWKRYGSTPDAVVELRRLCCDDDAPKNAESFLIGRSLKWLKRHTAIETVVSYADAAFGHTGTIYRASNFEHIGMTAPGRVIVTSDGRRFHDKAIRTRYKGRLKPFAAALRESIERGEAWYEKTPGKHIYVYRLRERVARHAHEGQEGGSACCDGIQASFDM